MRQDVIFLVFVSLIIFMFFFSFLLTISFSKQSFLLGLKARKALSIAQTLVGTSDFIDPTLFSDQALFEISEDLGGGVEISIKNLETGNSWSSGHAGSQVRVSLPCLFYEDGKTKALVLEVGL